MRHLWTEEPNPRIVLVRQHDQNLGCTRSVRVYVSLRMRFWVAMYELERQGLHLGTVGGFMPATAVAGTVWKHSVVLAVLRVPC